MLYLRRIPYIPLAAVLLVLAILCGGCGRSGDAQAGPAVLGAEERAEAAALLDAQLGLLKDEINDTEYERCLAFMETLYPLRRDRLEQDRYEKSAEERRMVERLNQLYERYTAKYLGDGGTWGVRESLPAGFGRVPRQRGREHPGGRLEPDPGDRRLDGGGLSGSLGPDAQHPSRRGLAGFLPLYRVY